MESDNDIIFHYEVRPIYKNILLNTYSNTCAVYFALLKD